MKSSTDGDEAAAVAVVGIDIGKDVFHLVAFDAGGKVTFRRKIKRLQLADTFKKLPSCVVGMEACLSAHYVSRTLEQLGHDPRIIPAMYVKPFLRGQKNDYNDAEAIAEAALRPNLRSVRQKTAAELELQAFHRVRSRLVSRRTATINQIRSLLIEHGIAVRAGARALRNSLFEILKNREEEISPRMSALITDLYEDWLWLDKRIESITAEIEEVAQREDSCRLLMSVPGVGPLISTAMVAAIGGGEAFERGRDFGAWLGLVPKQFSTGGRPILGRISKRGDRYLRTLFIQAANVLLMRPHRWEQFSFGPWLQQLAPRLHRNKLATALANKLARISWSVLRHAQPFGANLQEVKPI
jgi:transposase